MAKDSTPSAATSPAEDHTSSAGTQNEDPPLFKTDEVLACPDRILKKIAADQCKLDQTSRIELLSINLQAPFGLVCGPSHSDTIHHTYVVGKQPGMSASKDSTIWNGDILRCVGGKTINDVDDARANWKLHLGHA